MRKSCDNPLEESGSAFLLPLVDRFLQETDYAEASRRAIRADLLKFGRWFCSANNERFDPSRVTLRDCSDFRDDLGRARGQAVATVNRALVSVRQFFSWLVAAGLVERSPAEGVKELRNQELAPKTLDRAHIRKILREADARQDRRAAAIFSLILYCGCRVGEVCNLRLGDLLLNDRSGWAVLKHAKGNKQRQVPIPLHARRCIQAYLDARPPVQSDRLFIGERGPLTTRGVRSIFAKYSALAGIRVHPHLLRHCFGREYLAANQNDLVGLAALMGHEDLNTTKRYVARTHDELQAATDRMAF
jgi:site-specific recombinase XerD